MAGFTGTIPQKLGGPGAMVSYREWGTSLRTAAWGLSRLGEEALRPNPSCVPAPCREGECAHPTPAGCQTPTQGPSPHLCQYFPQQPHGRGHIPAQLPTPGCPRCGSRSPPMRRGSRTSAWESPGAARGQRRGPGHSRDRPAQPTGYLSSWPRTSHASPLPAPCQQWDMLGTSTGCQQCSRSAGTPCP